MLWIDLKYANILGSRLNRFKVRSQKPFIAQFRCHYCGDSATNKYKTRGYLIEKGSRILYYCHNCHKSTTLGNALRDIDTTLHSEYMLDTLKEKAGTSHTLFDTSYSTFKSDISKFAKRRHENFEPFKTLKKVSQLPNDHIAKRYCIQRQIPASQHYRLYYTDSFKKFTNTCVPGKFSSTDNDSSRLIIPFIDQNGYVYGYQGRALDNDKVRYITIMIDETKPRLFGFDTVDISKDIIVTEGPIDSFFVPNAIAMCGGDNTEIDKLNLKDRIIFCLDNEPRNKDTVGRMLKAIEKGYRVCIWPSNIEQKDINEMVLNGLCQEEISGTIFSNTYNGLSAQLKLQEWKKV